MLATRFRDMAKATGWESTDEARRGSVVARAAVGMMASNEDRVADLGGGEADVADGVDVNVGGINTDGAKRL